GDTVRLPLVSIGEGLQGKIDSFISNL
ncbi:MAG: hypothetical protein ACI93N_002400, partial [Flavobacteriaceae bacterium]